MYHHRQSHILVFFYKIWFLSMMAMISTKIDNFKQHGFMVNFNKCVRTMDRIKNIKLYQTNPYINGKHVKSLDFLQKILYAEFFNMKDYTEDKIWNISTAVKKADEKAAGIKKK